MILELLRDVSVLSVAVVIEESAGVCISFGSPFLLQPLLQDFIESVSHRIMRPFPEMGQWQVYAAVQAQQIFVHQQFLPAYDAGTRLHQVCECHEHAPQPGNDRCVGESHISFSVNICSIKIKPFKKQKNVAESDYKINF